MDDFNPLGFFLVSVDFDLRLCLSQLRHIVKVRGWMGKKLVLEKNRIPSHVLCCEFSSESTLYTQDCQFSSHSAGINELKLYVHNQFLFYVLFCVENSKTIECV